MPRVKYYGIDFVHPDTGWAAGEQGAIIRTTNGGVKWQQVQSGIQTKLLAVDSYDGQTVIAVGESGKILRSTNAGGTWNQIPSGVTSGLWNVQMINNALGWIVGSQSIALKTTDGGQNWANQPTGISGLTFWSVHFSNERLGYIAASGGTILRTTNGGSDWQTQQVGDGSALYTIYALDSLRGVAGGFAGEILHTTNAGINWQELPRLGSTINDFAFADSLRGFATGDGGYFLTANGGASWDERMGPNGFGLSCPSQTVVYGTGEKPLEVLKSINADLSFANLIPNRDFENVSFPTEQVGWVSGGLSWLPGDSLLKTTDAGLTWTKQGNFVDAFPRSLLFLDTLVGFVGTQYGRIYKTTDGGTTWIQKPISGLPDTVQMGPFTKIFFLNQRIGWGVTTFRGLIAKTSDGGENWVVQFIPPFAQFSSIHFSDTLNGWAVEPHDVYKTTNGGSSWVKHPDLNFDIFEDIHFINLKSGWLTGSQKLYKTIDSGKTWILAYSPGILLGKMVWVTSSHGFLLSISNRVLETRDSGATWYEVMELRGQGIRAMSFPRLNVGYGVGTSGLIMSYRDTTITRVGSDFVPDTKSFKLYQNYPNPFNPETKITFEILDNQSVVSLKLFDVLGRELLTLVHEKLESGRYEVTIEPDKLAHSGLASGVYFYRLTSESKRGFLGETRRMILLR